MTSDSPPSEWNGVYYDGVSAAPHPVSIRLSSTGLLIIARSGSQLSWQYEDIRQTQGKYSGEEIRFERGNGICETLVIADPTVLTTLHETVPEQVKHFHNPARRRQRILLTILAAVASIPLLWAAFTWGIPWLSGPITKLIPIAWEEQLGEFMVTKLAPPEKQCTDPQVVTSLESIVATLNQSVESNPYSFHIYVADSPMVNALAGPGGHIIVFRGLLKSTKTAEEMAGVLAHEMQHILKRHSMRLLVQHASISFAVGALSGDVSGIMTFGLQAAHLLQTLSYRQDAEGQADEHGIGLLMNAGINPQGMLNFFQTLKAKHQPNGLSQYLATHPSTDERIEHLKTLIPQTFKPTTSLLRNTDWGKLRELCGSRKDTIAL